MKKFFTLIACALVAGSAFAQDYLDPVDVITNGKIAWNNQCADGDFSKYPAEKLANFYSQDWDEGAEEGTFVSHKGATRVTVYPEEAAAFADAVLDQTGFATLHYCLVATSTNAASNSWDSQFFITFGEANALGDGDKIKLSMKIKAESAATVSTQAHTAPGSYINGQSGMFGNIDFTTDWVEYTSDEVTVATQAGMYSIAFNLNEDKTLANKFYFDDIVVTVTKKKALEADEPVYDKTIPEGFEDIIANGDLEGEGVANFVVNDYLDKNDKKTKVNLGEARVIADPSNAENKCIIVTTDASPAQEYDAQFFITDPKHHFYEGDVIRLRMRVKADESQSSGTQSHAAPGSYIYWACVGDVKFVKDFWTNFDSGDITVSASMMKSNNNPGPFKTIALNLSKVAAGNNVYFDDIQLLVKRADPLAAAKSDLTAAVALGDVASDFQKTEASYGAFEQAVTEGQLTLDDAEATKADLEAATKAIEDAFAALAYVSGYTPLSADMYKDYTDAANPAATKCAYNLYESVDCTFGDLNAPAAKYADVSDYDELVIVSSGDTKPRVIINADKGEEGLDIALGTDESAYVIALDEPANAFVIDLAAITKDQGYARLNAIRKPGTDAGITVTDQILGKGTATSITEAKVAKVAKAIFNVAGQQIKSLQKGLNIVDGKKIFVK
jgi:hypothetical protein